MAGVALCVVGILGMCFLSRRAAHVWAWLLVFLAGIAAGTIQAV